MVDDTFFPQCSCWCVKKKKEEEKETRLSSNKSLPSPSHNPTGKAFIWLSNEIYRSLIKRVVPEGRNTGVYMNQRGCEAREKDKMWECIEGSGCKWKSWRGSDCKGGEGRKPSHQQAGDGAGGGGGESGRGNESERTMVWRKKSPQTTPSARLSWSCLAAVTPASDTHTHTRTHTHTSWGSWHHVFEP